MSAGLVPVHPQRGDNSAELRWLSPVLGGVPDGERAASELPSPLAALLVDGTLAAVRISGGEVITRLADTHTWPDAGPRVRSAVQAALAEPWPTGSAPTRSPGDGAVDGDEAIRVAAEQLLAGSVGHLAASHGGRIELLSVRDGIVEVTLHGACHGCAAARSTLLNQLEEPLRAQCPQLREVRAAGTLRQLGVRLPFIARGD